MIQIHITELFGRDIDVISRHIKNIFAKPKLDQKAICKIYTFQIQTNQVFP